MYEYDYSIDKIIHVESTYTPYTTVWLTYLSDILRV